MRRKVKDNRRKGKWEKLLQEIETQKINLLDFQRIGKGKNGEPGNPYDILDDKIAEYITQTQLKMFVLNGVPYLYRWGVYKKGFLISNKFTKLQAAYNRERSGNERLSNRLEAVLEENRELRMVAADFDRVKAVVGSEQVNAVINRAKQQEQMEAERERAARRKHNREARWQVTGC